MSDLYRVEAGLGLEHASSAHALLVDQYWCRGIPLGVIEKAIAGSLCFGVFHENELVGFSRVISDQATFAYLCDVVVHPSHRGRGIGKMLVARILAEPSLQGLRRYLLATLDAHGLYRQFGFEVTKTPEWWMEIKVPAPYGRQQEKA